MYGVEWPQSPKVEETVHPIANGIGEDQHLDRLQPSRLSGDRSTGDEEILQLRQMDIETKHRGCCRQSSNKSDISDSFCDERREKPEQYVSPHGSVLPIARRRCRSPLDQ